MDNFDFHSHHGDHFIDAPFWGNYLDDDDEEDEETGQSSSFHGSPRPRILVSTSYASFVSGADPNGELRTVQVFMSMIGARAAYGFENADLYFREGHDVLLAHNYVAAFRISQCRKYTRSCLNKLHPRIADLVRAVLSTGNGYAYKVSQAIQIIAVANFLARHKDGYCPVASNQNKLNTTLVIIGHVGSGKSTMCDHLSFLLDTLDADLVDGIRHEYPEVEDIREINFARISEKLRGARLVEDGGANVINSKFVSTKYHGTLLDTPVNHGNSLNNEMIEAALDADYAIVNIDCSILDFECSSVQLIEHASILHTLGVKYLICAFNKMDATVPPFSKNVFEEFRAKVQLLMFNVGFSPDCLKYIPVSGLYGENLTTISIYLHWFTGPTLLESINSIPKMNNECHKPLRIPLEGVCSMDGVGNVPYGRVETGTLKTDSIIKICPINRAGKVVRIEKNKERVTVARPGDTVAIQVKGMKENDAKAGHVASNLDENPAIESTHLIGRVFILNSGGQIKRGFTAALKCHKASTKVEFTELIFKISPRSGELVERSPDVLVRGDVAFVKMVLCEPIVVEAFHEFQNLGRFVLKEEGQIVAVGVIVRAGKTIHSTSWHKYLAAATAVSGALALGWYLKTKTRL